MLYVELEPISSLRVIAVLALQKLRYALVKSSSRTPRPARGYEPLRAVDVVPETTRHVSAMSYLAAGRNNVH
jgi:hypothetical protein